MEFDLIDDFYNSYLRKMPDYKKSSFNYQNKKTVKILKELNRRLLGSYPFYHPYYAGQMLKPPHRIAVMGYLSGMLVNSNNHALDGGPVTTELEKESVKMIAGIFNWKKYLGHLTSGGTMANMEALWIAKKMKPDGIFVIGDNAHYTHARLSDLIDFKYKIVNTDSCGRIDLNHLEDILNKYKVGTVICTLGTTGFGALDQIEDLILLKNKYNFRLHADAAYGGFYKILANMDYKNINKSPFNAVEAADSIAIDPHKHGLQPYGCGCILFKDPSVGKFYKHDSPYTYFTSNKLHPGEVTLECSRPGAAAAALWVTLKLFPLDNKNGLYKILKDCREAANKFYKLLSNDEKIKVFIKPELDIVNYFIHGRTTKIISDINKKIFHILMEQKNNTVYLSLNRVKSDFFLQNVRNVRKDSGEVVLLRSVLMKPEHKEYAEEIYEIIKMTIEQKIFTKQVK